MPSQPSSLHYGAFLLALAAGTVPTAGSSAQPVIVSATTDAVIRTDLDVRRNDNYGCDAALQVGTSRGGGGIPFGGADAMRSFVAFDLSGVPAGMLVKAELEIAFWTFGSGTGSSTFTVDVHRVLAPWSEGNGTVNTPFPSGCVGVDPASGIAWEALDPENETQPSFDPLVVASTSLTQGGATPLQPGDLVRWDVTPLVAGWLDGSYPNYGVALRDPTSDGSFRELYFASAEHALYPQFAPALPAPRLVLTFAPLVECVGFEAPMASGPVTVKKNRALPLKALLLDEGGLPVTSANLAAPPVVQVLFTSSIGGAAEDVSADAVPAGLSSVGNQFVFANGKWQYNLKIQNFTAPGSYQVSMLSGDGSEYGVLPTCQGTFVIE